jgi:hypothetical protein
MASEPNVVEIYVDIETKELLIYIPAADMLDNGEDLPKDAAFVKQININDVIDQAKILKADELHARL